MFMSGRGSGVADAVLGEFAGKSGAEAGDEAAATSGVWLPVDPAFILRARGDGRSRVRGPRRTRNGEPVIDAEEAAENGALMFGSDSGPAVRRHSGGSGSGVAEGFGREVDRGRAVGSDAVFQGVLDEIADDRSDRPGISRT